MSSTRFFAVVSILLGVAAIVLPYFFGTLAVMALGGVMLASGIVGLLYVNDARKQDLPVRSISSINVLFPSSLEYPPVVRQPSTRLRRDIGRNPSPPSREMVRRRRRFSEAF